MKHTRIIVLVAAALAATLSMSSAAAVTGTLTIDSVGGFAIRNGRVAAPVSGVVDVTGQARVDGQDDTPAPLVADAGDSAFVAAGDPATLLGAGFGGKAPYTFAWTASAGTVAEGADSATAVLDTTGVTTDRITATLMVTDAAGDQAQDTVQVVVAEAPETLRLLDQSTLDPTPGVLSAGAPGFLDFPFAVAAGTDRIDVTASWEVAANDYDLTLVDPAGNERVVVGDPPGITEEATSFASPEPGTWTARVHKFATVSDTVRVVVDAVVRGTDPRPAVDSGGPYRFLIDAPQSLTGTVTGGSAPVHAAWDLDGDGRYEAVGATVTPSLRPGRHLVTFKATDAAGLERRETTSVLVADAARLAEDTTALTVVGVADTGINPYHLEFSADTYPDPDVLALTANFTRHPSEYIAGYPADAPALPVTLGQGWFPAQDEAIWTGGAIEGNRLYWIPGTKIIGAIDADVSTGATSSSDPHPILDDNGHGTGSASVSTGNRYGYCATCLLVVIEGLEEGIATTYPWVDITSHSFGYQFGLPIGPALGPNEATKAAAERGQTVLFAAGNGIGNAFDVPIATYGSDQTGPDWNITVGALRRDNQRGIVGDGIPVHISSWGDGNLPSACGRGTVGQCAFGGTSAATPYTAGVFGTVLTRVRDALGDPAAGQRTVGPQGQVVADGVAIDESQYLADGLLTRAELREAVLKTAFPLEGNTSMFPYPATAPYNSSTNVLIEGYGAATPDGARRAVDVLLGRTPPPDRSAEDAFFAFDRQVRDTIYGGYDRDGDGIEDFEGLSGGLAALGLGGLAVADALAVLATPEGALGALARVVEASAASVPAPVAAAGEQQQWFLHRRHAGLPGTAPACGAGSNELYLDRSDTAGDIEPCFESRITSVLAAYRPLAIWASTETLDQPLPAGSTVSVDLYLTTENPALVRPTGVLMATDREIGTGPGSFAVVPGSGPGPGSAVGAVVATVPLPDLGGCATLGEACWTRSTWSFVTTRPAFAGEQLTFQVQLVGTRAWSFGYEGAHASSVTITPAAVPGSGFEFGATITSPAEGDVLDGGSTVVAGGSAAFPDQGTDPTGAGDHPTQSRVEVAVDDPSFGAPVEASYDDATGAWSAPLRDLGDGPHTLYARARVGERVSEASSVTFRVRPGTRVEWQVVARNATPAPTGWQEATGLAPYTFSFDTAAYGRGAHTIVTRLVADGSVVAQQSVRASFGRG